MGEGPTWRQSRRVPLTPALSQRERESTAWVWALSFVLFTFPATAQDLRRTTVTVSDHLSEGQHEETIAVYFAGVLAGTLHVAPDKPDDSFTATILDRDHIGYTLCGRLERQEADGSLSSHPIDNGGVLSGYAGQTLMATTHGDVLFSLESDSGAVTSAVQPGPACTAAVS